MEDKISIAKKLINECNYESAIEILEAYKQFCNNWEVFFELGKIYYIKKDFLKSNNNLKQAINLNKCNVEIQLLLAKVLNELNFNFSSLKLLLKIRKNNIDNENILKNVDDEVMKLFYKDKKYFLVIKYFDSYSITTENLKLQAVKYFIAQLAYYNSMMKVELVKSLSESALKKLVLTKKDRNSILNELEIANRNIIMKSYPRELSIAITGKCNLRCKMCKHNTGLFDNISLSEEQVNKIIDIFEYVERIHWFGGEVFLYKNFMDLVSKANSCNIKQDIVSNGLLITEEIANKLFENNVALGLSIDSVDRNIYENIRYGGKYDTILKNVNNIKKCYGKKNRDKLRIHSVLSRWNYNNINNFIDIVNFANDSYCSGVTIYVDECEEDENLKKYYINSFNNKRDELYKLANKLDIELEVLVPSVYDEKNIKKYKMTSNICDNQYSLKCRKDCFMPWKDMLFDFSGCVSVAPNCPFVGSLEHNDILDIWNGDEFQKIRKQVIYNRKW